MNIHITRKGEIIDLLALPDAEFAFYSRCLNAYEQNTAYADFLTLSQGPDNPIIQGGVITKEAYQAPLFRAIWDLGRRLAILQSVMGADGDTDLTIGPTLEDDFVSPYDAAKRVGVSAPAIHAAIKDGRLAAHQEINGRWKVSVLSLERYSPDPIRQAAAKK